MILSWRDLSILLLYLVTAIVAGTSDDKIELQRKNSHERKAIPIHKSRPLPGHHSTTTASSLFTYNVTYTEVVTEATSKVNTLTSEIFTTQSNWTTTSTIPNASEPTTGPTFHPITAPPVNNTCQSLLEQYGNLSSLFTNCAIIHAKPALYCENCVQEYVATLDAYATITADLGTHKCKDTLLSSDRVQIVNQLHNFVLDLWDDGNCDSCFEDVKNCNATKTCSLRPDIRRFMQTYNDTMKCFVQFLDQNQAEVCLNCSHLYKQLNERYEDTGSLDETCMDVVELMNHTRIQWSASFKCTKFKKDIGSVIAMGCFVGVLPLFFYCAVRVHAEKQTRKYMRQKRLSYVQPQSNIQYQSASSSSH